MYFRLDNTATPGWAKVEIVKELKPKLEPIFLVKIIEITRPSSSRKCQVGNVLSVAKRYLYHTMPAQGI